MKKSYLLFLMIAFGAVCSLASVPEPFEKKGKFGLQDAETGEVLVKPKYTSIVELIAYSDSGKILGSRVASRMAMYSTSHALDLVVWMGTVCPYYKDYSIF